jgi:23S rRNA (guanosine2251-2'-O)-methyltransferase
MKIEGRNTVAEAIKSGKTIDRLVVSKDVKDAGGNRIIADAKSRNIKIMFYDKSVLDRESETKRHQGFIAEITDYKYSTVEEILNYASEKNEKPFIIIVDGVEDPHNLGSIIRVADCSGCHGVIIPRHRNVTVNETVIKVSAGAASHVKVAKVTNVNDAIEYLKEHGYKSFYVQTWSGNAAMIKVAEKIGFREIYRKENFRKVDGKMYDAITWRIDT